MQQNFLSRQAILTSIRANMPAQAVEHPGIPRFE